MDFARTETQDELASLATTILEDQVDHDRLKAIEATDERFDRDLWQKLSDADLVGIAIPEAHGGLGFGLIELGVFAEALGRSVPYVPALVSCVAALAVAEFGDPDQQARILPGAAAGESILTTAVTEPVAVDPAEPATLASRTGTGWTLDGTKIKVPYAHVASEALVSARTGDDSFGLFLVDLGTAGVTIERTEVSNQEAQFTLTLSNVAVGEQAALGETDGRHTIRWLIDRYTALLCAMDLGIASKAVDIAADFTKEREQFDQPIGAFQAVHQRIADCYIETQAIRLVTWQAIWRVAEGEPVEEALPIAKYWASEKAYNVCFAAIHLHGGMGVDVDYPLHRYYLWARELELALGSGTPQLARFGEYLATAPVDLAAL